MDDEISMAFCCFILHPYERHKTIGITDGLRCYQAEIMGKTRTDARRNEFRSIADLPLERGDEGHNRIYGLGNNGLGNRCEQLPSWLCRLPTGTNRRPQIDSTTPSKPGTASSLQS
jgi:hypothetical protein